MDGFWTITELAAQAAAVLSADQERADQERADRERADQAGAEPRPSGRVRDLPDARTIRWYQTTGLVDRPVALRGRTALYGRRQLVQLIAINRLQAQGRQLSAIQAELAGAPDHVLEELAGLVGRTGSTGQTEPTEPTGQTGRRAEPVAEPVAGPTVERGSAPDADRVRARFWTAPPAARTAQGPPATPATVPETTPHSGTPQLAIDTAVHGVRLTPGVLLVFDSPGTLPHHGDMEAIRTAAAPLLAILRERGLLPASAGHTSHPTGYTTDSADKEPA